MTQVLELRGLSAGYGPLRVLHDIDLSVARGERVGIAGLNGHGKTTLLRSVMGLVDWRRGEIELDGKSIVRTPTHKLARAGVVLMPQGDALFPGLSVKDNLDSGAFAAGWRERKQRREERPPADEAPKAAPKAGEKGKKLKEEMDKIVDEIDSVLEENAEEFMKSYVQRGGQ